MYNSQQPKKTSLGTVDDLSGPVTAGEHPGLSVKASSLWAVGRPSPQSSSPLPSPHGKWWTRNKSADIPTEAASDVTAAASSLRVKKDRLASTSDSSLCSSATQEHRSLADSAALARDFLGEDRPHDMFSGLQTLLRGGRLSEQQQQPPQAGDTHQELGHSRPPGERSLEKSAEDLHRRRLLTVIDSPLLRRHCHGKSQRASTWACVATTTASVQPELRAKAWLAHTASHQLQQDLPTNPEPSARASPRRKAGNSVNRQGVPQRRGLDFSSSDGKSIAPPSSSSISYYRVVVLGEDGVGKTTLIRQFASSPSQNPAAQKEVYAGEEDYCGRVVVRVGSNGTHCHLEIIDNPLEENIDLVRPDAFLVMYSMSDRKSFLTAAEVTQHLRCELGIDRPMLLLANKADLKRQQNVALKEGLVLAGKYDCKFMELSATLQHNLDQLLLRVLDAITQNLIPPRDDTLTSASDQSKHVNVCQSGKVLKSLSKLLHRKFFKRTCSRNELLSCG